MSKSVFPYPGGKSYLAPWIIRHMPDHKCYVEVFGGSAAVLVTKNESHTEVYNDRDGDIVQFFKVLRDSKSQLVEWLNTTPYSRDVYKEYARDFYSGKRPDDSIERAGRFFYLRYSQYASKYCTKSGFSSASKRNKARRLRNATKKLDDFAERFHNVQIENLDYSKVFERYDFEDAFFYCDPPYVAEGDALYSHDGEFDHGRFVDSVKELDGKWMISYMDLPPGLEDYHVVERDASQHMNKGNEKRRKTATERLVMNYDPKDTPLFSEAQQSGLSDW